jgi:hypothetical protein
MTRACAFVALAVLVLTTTPACKQKVTQADCDRLIDRFATLVVKERKKDATAAEVHTEIDRERQEARGDEAFRNCTSEIAPADYACAMKAETSDAFLKCLE